MKVFVIGLSSGQFYIEGPDKIRLETRDLTHASIANLFRVSGFNILADDNMLMRSSSLDFPEGVTIDINDVIKKAIIDLLPSDKIDQLRKLVL